MKIKQKAISFFLMTFPSHFMAYNHNIPGLERLMDLPISTGSTAYFGLPTTHQLSATPHPGCVDRSSVKSGFITSASLSTYDSPTPERDLPGVSLVQ
jgi:hypothetical protein